MTPPKLVLDIQSVVDNLVQQAALVRAQQQDALHLIDFAEGTGQITSEQRRKLIAILLNQQPEPRISVPSAA